MSDLEDFLSGSDTGRSGAPDAVKLAALSAVGLTLGGALALLALAARRVITSHPEALTASMSSHEEIPMPISSSTSLSVLRSEYASMYARAVVKATSQVAADEVVQIMARSRDRYAAAGAPHGPPGSPGVPWYVVAIIHAMEGGGKDGDFSKHLHNGDPLTARTTNFPPGKPITGSPPFTWEESAADALARFNGWSDWSLTGTLYQLERYNGMGYRNKVSPPKATPYLWSGTNLYTVGKFIRDRVYDPNAVSRQVGAVTYLKRMEALGIVPRF